MNSIDERVYGYSLAERQLKKLREHNLLMKEALRQISWAKVNGVQSLSASVAKGVLAKVQL